MRNDLYNMSAGQIGVTMMLANINAMLCAASFAAMLFSGGGWFATAYGIVFLCLALRLSYMAGIAEDRNREARDA